MSGLRKELPEERKGLGADPVEKVLQSIDEFRRRWAGVVPEYR